MTLASPTDGRPVGPLVHLVRDARRRASAVARLARWRVDDVGFAPPRRAPSRSAEPGRGPADARPLYTARIVPSTEDPELDAGRRRNVALVAARLDGLALSAGRDFSFCRAVGPLDAAHGFVAGRELRGGCLVPAVGGGVCLVSNALFEAGVRLGWRVVERHGHSLVRPDLRPAGTPGLDATVRWPDVDLRLRPDRDVVLELRTDGDVLVLEVLGDGRSPSVDVRRHVRDDGDVRRETVERSVDGGPWEVVATSRRRLAGPEEAHRSCWTCGGTSCRERTASLASRPAPVAPSAPGSRP